MLLTVLSPQKHVLAEDPRKAELDRLMPEVMKHLKGKHATMQFVHETFYKKQCPDGYGYSQFKLHVSRYCKSHDYSYHNDYKPGKQMQIDFGLQPLTPEARLTLLTLLEDRYEEKSVIITSQLPLDRWYDYIAEPTLADAIMDRLINSSEHIELKGETLRHNRRRK